MKKILFAAVLMVLAVGNLQAQTFSEWFSQNKTQKKYLLQQIAALKVYTDFAQKGYKIAKDGLSAFGAITGGEFNLHSLFLNSLKTVNPHVRDYPKVADIIGWGQKIASETDHSYSYYRQSEAFTPAELRYIKRVFDRLLEACEAIMDDLDTVIGDNRLEMKDDERMERIGLLYDQMQDNYTFCKSFTEETKTMVVARIREKNETQTGRALRGIQNPQP